MRLEKLDNSVNIAILTSGKIESLENIIKYFESYLDVNISCIITNKDFNTNILNKYKIDIYNTQWYKEIDNIITKNNIHYIVCSDFSEILPPNFCKKYKNKIINLHKSLLPKYQNLSEHDIYKNVLLNKDDNFGISVHLVDVDYIGTILFQKSIKIHTSYDVADIKNKIDELSLRFYPTIIENIIKGTYKYLYK